MRWNYTKVKEYVNQNSNSKLLSKEYINYETKMKFKCECGAIYETNLDKFIHRNKRQCNKCSREKSKKNSRLQYNEIKKYIEQNSNCKLISKDYTNAHSKLLLKCGCGNVFNVAYKHFRNSNQRQCPECGKKIRTNKKKLNFEFVKKNIEKNKWL